MVRDADPGLSPDHADPPDGPVGSIAGRLAGLARTVNRWVQAPLPPPPASLRRGPLIALVGVDPEDAEAHVESLQAHGRYRATTVPPPHSRDPITLIALRLGGDILHPDHGYPARLIAPNRPGVLQTKWVARITARSPK